MPPTDALVGSAVVVGRFSYDDGEWTWSDEVYAVHGFARGDVRPSTALMLAHHDRDGSPDDDGVAETALRSGSPYAVLRRILDAERRRRVVVMTGDGGSNGDGVRLDGYLLDLTDVLARETKSAVDEEVAGFERRRAVIEQAKGMMMLALGLEADEAFGLMRAYSQRHNVKIRDVAERAVRAARDGRPHGAAARLRSLLTA